MKIVGIGGGSGTGKSTVSYALVDINPELNQSYDKTFYFDLDEKTRHWRRDKGAVLAKDEYLHKVLEPMHRQFVEPTKANADVAVNVSKMTVEEVYNLIHRSVASLPA
ncbi:MAG TPA: hypothetical protein VH234_05035 [Candidatus Saccharimonadales bacterium]|jgi:uridine kinase|nr:hypothetical protein [Candidatus Saccharimonadales bacterium]